MATTTLAAHRILNGVDVTALGETLAAVQAKPELGQFQFRNRNRWLGGSLNRSTIKGFYGAGAEDTTRAKPYEFDNDEPPILLGKDRGANPVEYLLHALAGCMTTTMVYHAASRGIAIDALESNIEGDIDIRGFTGLSPDVPKGYREIRTRFRVKTDAKPEALAELARMSPVFNTIAGSVPVKVEVETY
jgi:uncharacterized OsmC-like protein